MVVDHSETIHKVAILKVAIHKVAIHKQLSFVEINPNLNLLCYLSQLFLTRGLSLW